MRIENRLASLGIVLPTPCTPVAAYVPSVICGNLLYLAGQGPQYPDGRYELGKVGANVPVEAAHAHARLAGINHLAVMRAMLGDLDRVVRIVKVLGMVNATPEFTFQPEVINGYSELMVEVFGEGGRHARSAVGMGSLPFGMTVEVEAIVEIIP